MKKTMILGMALGLALTATSAMAVQNGTIGVVADKTGGTGIVGSYHDLSNASYGDSQSRICIFCHHPHQSQSVNAAGLEGGDGRADYMPLWNHDVTQQVFNAYDNGNGPTSGRNALNAVQTGPGGVSLLCLSCHDGSVALNAYSNFSTGSEKGATDQAIIGGSYTAGAANRALIGGNSDMSNHHPIGFNYNDVVALDAEIADPGRKINANGTTIQDLLYGGSQFECVTCHDVHNSQNSGEKFLWISNDKSNFCLTCHLKDGTTQNESITAGPATN